MAASSSSPRKSKNQTRFISNLSSISHYNQKSMGKNLAATILFLEFSKEFNSIDSVKMEQIAIAYGFPKETFIDIMMLFKNTEGMFCSPDGDSDFFDIVTGVLQGELFALNMFILCIDFVFQTSIDRIK